MREKPRIAVPWGGGLDRATGLADDRPGWWQELRNLEPREQRVAARGGLEEVVSVAMTGDIVPDDIIHLGLFESQAKGLFVAFKQGVADNLEVFRVTTNGLNPVSCGAWDTLPPSVPRPLIFGVESFKKYFLAHDEEVYADRLVTQVLDDSFTLADLQADLDGAGTVDVKFRGVRSYLDRLVGWGGLDLPHRINMSMPGAPTDFRKEAYFNAGQPSTPVLSCEVLPDRLLVFKSQQTFEVFGSVSADFGIRVIDPVYGLGGTHLAVVVAGRCYYWSLEGPRLQVGGEDSVDLGVPLDLDGEMPANLVEEGDRAYGFVEYLPNKRVVAWRFPNRSQGKTRSYCLSVRDPATPRWFYTEHQRALYCSGVLFAAPGGPPTGYPLIGAIIPTSNTLTVPFDNITADGDETVEMWLQEDGGGYGKVREVLVDGASQTEDLGPSDGVSAGHTYDVALRYRRGVRFTANYDDPVTAGWGGTEIGHSVGSASTDSSPNAPSDPVQDACEVYPSGPKFYMKIGFTWTNHIVSGTTDIYEATNSTDFADAVYQTTVPVAGGDDRIDNYGDWLVSPGGSGTRTIWIQANDGAGGLSAPVLVATITPADGCAL